MLIEARLTRNQLLSRSLNNRVATISQTSETFGALIFMCECGIYGCAERIRLTIVEYDRIRLQPTQFLAYPDHILESIESVVEAGGGHYAVVEKLAGCSDEPLTRDTDALLASL